MEKKTWGKRNQVIYSLKVHTPTPATEVHRDGSASLSLDGCGKIRSGVPCERRSRKFAWYG